MRHLVGGKGNGEWECKEFKLWVERGEDGEICVETQRILKNKEEWGEI